MNDEVVIHGVFKPFTELQISVDNSIQSIPLSNEEYKRQVKFKEEQ
ncbi:MULTISPECIES: hypothetical protein [Staphylococcus]|uniref:Uncharacterized protein n=1 Tax=Staphylococcus capitis TaxID=29388 RepID=A0ABX1SPG4_STACP|nr:MULTISPECIES: hypothetical protein [Staphylococcus]MBF8049246.1 hypothetical protein [Staphylococcus capitis]MBF8131999.1 hypothetical protein [Staphylococcus capitis]MBM6127398.1 hypothetical protein [Staphylococcus epidermidis]MBM6134134.1 hypothetical protein [Staphylococcus epidermidis]MBM6136368.1 hypothetical protein [Staphylococcus epidermidis]